MSAAANYWFFALAAVVMPVGQAVFAQATAFSHGDPTSYEQYMLELVNAARRDPAGTASRLGIDLNQDLAPGTISTGSKPPLAFHPQLIQAARGHSDWMLDTGIFSHSGVDGTTPTQRAARAGYPFGVAENIAYRSTNKPPDYSLMTRVIHDSLVKSVSHRVNIMGETFGVLGIGLRPGTFEGFNAFMGTQNFSDGGATEDSGPFITGVCYDDADGDNAYDPGEGLGSVRVDTSLGQRHAVTSASGGYAIPLLPVATNTATKNLPFPVDGTPWSAVEVIEAQYRAEQIAAATGSTVQVVWSGGPLTAPVTNEVVVRQPVRLNYTLVGTDGRFYTRTMVTAQSVKKDLRLGASGLPTPAPSPPQVRMLPAQRSVLAGKKASLMVMVTADAMTGQSVHVTFTSSNPAVPAPVPIAVNVPAKKSAKQKAKSGRQRVTVQIPVSAAGSTVITASVPGGSTATCNLTIKPRNR